jgi:glycogen operon protein
MAIAIGANHPATGALSPVDAAAWGAARHRLGAHPLPGGGAWSFAIYSRHAQRVLLELYAAASGEDASHDYWMARGGDDVWRAVIAGVEPGMFYGFRCWGPNFVWDERWTRGGSPIGYRADCDHHGHRFNPNKLLFDPYAYELSSDRESPEMRAAGHHGGMYLSGPDLYGGDGHPPVAARAFDTGRWAPKAVTVTHAAPALPSARPGFPQEDTLIYEVHLRGLSAHPSASELTTILAGVPGFEAVEDVPPEERGTYAGAARLAPYLRALGYNAVELLPVHELANALNSGDTLDIDRTIHEAPHGNYWGYMTYGFFAPDRHYARDRRPGGPTRELRAMIDAFHAHGVKVYLDVVYNHTGEQGLARGVDRQTAEILCFRGLDNAGYYALAGDGLRDYWQSTGCGNNLDGSSPPVQRLILDSLTHWATVMGVDGFRFDLAPVLGRSGPRFDYSTGASLLEAIARLAEEQGFDIIAEPWDVNERQTGAFPRGWAEWNDGFRDRVRELSIGAGDVRAFNDAVNGSHAQYADQGGPHKSVNLITAHDGFTLLDLVSYSQKHNLQPWPFGPSDGGADDNRSWDSGGDRALRRQRMRSLLAIQFFSRGIPLTVGGDELGRTQNGNNNPYKLDNSAMYTNYRMIRSHAPNRLPVREGMDARYEDNYGQETTGGEINGLFRFVRHLTELRHAHRCLRQRIYADLVLDAGDDVTYLFAREDGGADFQGWERCVRVHIDGSAVGDVDFMMLINMHHAEVDFHVPPAAAGKAWRRIIDTATWAEEVANVWTGEAAARVAGDYRVDARSVVVLEER